MNCSNNIQRKALSKSIKDDKLAHAYIVYGGVDDDRNQYVEEIVKEIFCTDLRNSPCGRCINCHKVENGNMEDLITVEKDNSSIKVEQIRELTAVLGNKPFTSRTVAVISHAHLMTPESQNKLLKSLEEPAPGTVLILNTANLYSLFPTIRSRCVTIKLDGILSDLNTELDERAANIVKYSMIDKPLNSIYNEISECVSNRFEAELLLNTMELFVRDMIINRYDPELLFYEDHKLIADRINWDLGYHFREYLKYIEAARDDLKKNLNWKYCFKNLIIRFKQEERYG